MKSFRCAIVILLLVLLANITIINAAEMETIQVIAGGRSTLTVNLNDGQKFSGSMSIAGGSGNDIDFYVRNPIGNTVLDLGRVSQGTTFEFTADSDGAYILNFENDFSIISAKTVTLTYDVSLPTIAGIDPILLFIIFLLIAIILIVALIVFRRSKKQKDVQSET